MTDPIQTAEEMRAAAAQVCRSLASQYDLLQDVLRRDACDDCAGFIEELPIAEREVPEAVREWCEMYNKKCFVTDWATDQDNGLYAFLLKEYPDACK